MYKYRMAYTRELTNYGKDIEFNGRKILGITLEFSTGVYLDGIEIFTNTREGELKIRSNDMTVYIHELQSIGIDENNGYIIKDTAMGSLLKTKGYSFENKPLRAYATCWLNEDDIDREISMGRVQKELAGLMKGHISQNFSISFETAVELLKNNYENFRHIDNYNAPCITSRAIKVDRMPRNLQNNSVKKYA